ncbi:MAG: HIT family protein [Candidatus Moranbacteria bacterium CG23_combo_of_CG06-09_8_20_14_all_35_22]|nr:MAG: HIT family protein [Candidatus Moranbacteria bacterium CG23_combo_of_CG06-09_8_20_14_all_35_22]
MKCLFCEIASNKITSFKVWENGEFFAFLDIAPINPGHILIIPKIHVKDVFSLSNDSYNRIFQVAKKLAKPLKKATLAKAIGLAIEGLGVSHAHIHLVPIHKGNDLNPERAKKASLAELKKMQKILLNSFKGL